jgi:hypothetical protein
MLPVIEGVFAEELDGHKLIANRSLWRNFPTITNKTWVKGNAVLGGRRQGDRALLDRLRHQARPWKTRLLFSKRCGKRRP